nr:CASP-like protein 5A2 [Nicotiana tomentosiformis]
MILLPPGNSDDITVTSNDPWVTSTLTFAAASAAAGITVFIGNDIGVCSRNHCTEFETSTAMAFLSWFTALPSFLLNFWLLASR